MENLASLNRTASNSNSLTATSAATLQGFQSNHSGLQLQGLGGGASSSLNNCGSIGWYPYQQPYTYYYYVPSCAPAPLKPTAAELIALYKKEFGKDWKRMFAQTVKVEAR